MADGHDLRHEQIASASAAQALPKLEDWRRGIASALTGQSAGGAEKALAAWGARSAKDSAVAEEIRQSVLRAAMAGALHVRIVEVPESMRARRTDGVAPGTHATTRPIRLTGFWKDNDAFAAEIDALVPTARRVALAAGDPPDPTASAAFNLPFDEAVDDFLARRIVTPEEWAAMDDAARRRAFTATQLASDAMRARAYSALLRSLSDGDSYASFVRSVRSGEESLGVSASDPAYVETVFRTNVAAAYSAGRFQQMQNPDVLEARPFVEYRAVMDDRTTNRCKYCNGLIFDRRTDPGWVKFNPPTHFNCRSVAVVLGARDVDRSRVTHSSRVDARGNPQEGFGGAPSLDLDDGSDDPA